MGTKKDIQAGMDEEPLDDEELEGLLDDRERARQERLPHEAAYRDADKAMKAAVDERGLEPGVVYRVGAWRVAVEHTEAALVSFERGGKDRIVVAPAAAAG